MSKADMEAKKNGKNADNGSGVSDEALRKYIEEKENKEVPHAFNVLFTHKDEIDLDKTTRINGREAVFFSVNAVRDDALVPPKTLRNPHGRPSVSTCLRMHLKNLKISEGGKGRDDVKEVNTLSQEEANAQMGSRAEI